MLPVSFPEQNFTYKKPEGWTDEQCMDLPVWKGNIAIDDHGNLAPVIISCWQPSKEDIESIAAGKPIYLFVTGTVLSPVSLATENPFIPQPQKS